MSRMIPGRQVARWAEVGLALLAVAVFARTLQFEFVWDDIHILVGQAAYQAFDLNKLIFTPINGVEYFPLRDLTYIFDYLVWGWNPAGFHLTNLVLYILNVWVVYRFTLLLNSTLMSGRVANDSDGSLGLRVALATAGLFAVHPLHSEVVSFIHCRNVLVSGLFFFASCIFYLKFLHGNKSRNVLISLVFFTCALLAKATVIIVPLLFIAILQFRPERRAKDYLYLLPFLLLACGFFFLFKFFATESGVIQGRLAPVFGEADISSRVAVALQIPFFYLAKLLLPLGLSTEYGADFPEKLISVPVLLAFMGLGLLGFISYVLRKKAPQAAFAFAWYVICLVPVLNFFQTNPVVADRYAYLPSYAFAYVLAVGLCCTTGPLRNNRGFALLILILGTWSWLAFDRNDAWRTHESVMQDMTRSHSNQVKGFNSLGRHYFEAGQFARAFEHFEKASEISPAFSQLEYYRARLAFMQKRPDEALLLLESALLARGNEAYAWNLQGEILESKGDLMSAAWSYQKSLDSEFGTFFSRNYASERMQIVKRGLGPLLEETRRKLLEHPGDLNIMSQYANFLFRAGFRQEAAQQYQELLDLGGPKWEVYFNLGMLYRAEGRPEESQMFFEQSLALNASSSLIHNELGVLFKEEGRHEKAIDHFRQAIALDPAAAGPRVNLATLYFLKGEAEQARQQLRQIRDNFPEYAALANDYLSKID